jgi:hypothetical protein
MKLTTILVAALSLAFLTACDRGEPRPKTSSPTTAPTPSTSASGSTSTPTPSSANDSTKVERNPQQGQVDPKHNPQRKDFQTGGK